MLEESLLESKRRAYAEQSDDPEYTYAHADISEYLSPVETRAVRILREGLDTIRFSNAIGLYWKHHKRTGDSGYMTAVERDWNRLIAFAGHIAVESLSRPMARQFVDHLLSEGLKTTSGHKSRDSSARYEAIAQAYVQLPAADQAGTIVVTGTNASREAINARIHTLLGLKDKGHQCQLLARHDTTRAERSVARYYTMGDIVRTGLPVRPETRPTVPCDRQHTS